MPRIPGHGGIHDEPPRGQIPIYHEVSPPVSYVLHLQNKLRKREETPGEKERYDELELALEKLWAFLEFGDDPEEALQELASKSLDWLEKRWMEKRK